MSLKIIISNDGSHTLYDDELKETYHSLHGAIVEAEHVYINAGLSLKIKESEQITIFELGLGTGLNAFLTLKEVFNKNISVDYHVLEPFPIPEDIISQLNYSALIQNPVSPENFRKIHDSNWDEKVSLSSTMTFTKYKVTLEDYQPPSAFADLVYFDAFAPSKQPEIWSMENLVKIKNMMKPGGILVTYCSSGAFKRNMKECGFQLETLNGPAGKMEMSRVTKL